MKQKNPKIQYDKKSKVLSIEVKRAKSVDSDVQGNMVVDYDKKGDVVRVNFYQFSFEDFEENERAFSRESVTLVSA